jgi:hypothetical protein
VMASRGPRPGAGRRRSLYAENPSAFDDHRERITTLLATLAALALADAQRADRELLRAGASEADGSVTRPAW